MLHTVIWIRGDAIGRPNDQRARVDRIVMPESRNQNPHIHVTMLGDMAELTVVPSDICGFDICGDDENDTISTRVKIVDVRLIRIRTAKI